ncbi:MAG: anthranilate phosphoribosyltransferase [Candidatus Gastranaerophilales bacterium]|nr:anthranilate phosphoribosyltransferase [Candidatus Gastranaerophilales bacterium]
MIKAIIKKLTEGKNLSLEESSGLIDFIGDGYATPGQMAAFLTALKLKGETIDEITGFASKMRERALKVNIDGIDNIVDSCGTGGDCTNTFNISTASAILAASTGLHIAKHSNFGLTSKCGSSSVIEALGIPLVDSPEKVEESIKRHNISFIHAPYFHKCTSYINIVRKDIGIRTVFNFLGPLTNPAKPTGQILGVALPELCDKMAEALRNLDCKRALVVNGLDPVMDEISICGKTLVYRLENGKIDKLEIHPEDFGFKMAALSDIAGDTPSVNAKIIKDIFAGKIEGPKKEVLLINSAALLWAGYKADSIEHGIKIASEQIESGMALKKLYKLQEISTNDSAFEQEYKEWLEQFVNDN